MKKIVSILAFTILFISCKEEKKVQEPAKQEEPKKEFFSVELDVTCPVKDDFAVYYTEDNTINFNEQNTYWNSVKGQPDTQKIVFNFKEEIIPTHIRLDFGINKEQGDVLVEKLKFDFYGKSFEIKGSDFFKYFSPNDLIKSEIDEVKGTVKFLKNPKEFVTPFFYPNQTFLKEIKKITV
jgi:hypothetical protein